ncbi:hypothetical protein [Abiotrophia sp.]|uniref:hypothetical protein n=1 Tax=Abiotrophia sp. TaxID=76631 RepID=UPI001CAE7155|nr:hypothetical protein [Abiotrophia sp.]MBF0936603.1 hypothetical protein [Abiotrophia sp.]
MSKLVLSSLYFTSFMPLWVSVIFIDIKSCIENTANLWTERISLALIFLAIFISMITLFFAFRSQTKEGCVELQIKAASEDKTVTAEYLLAYILPLSAFDFTKWDQVVLFLVFFLTLGFLCIRHNHFTVNIYLEIRKYKTYTCEMENEDSKIVQCKVISKQMLNAKKGESIYLKSLNNEIKLNIEK